MLTRDWFSEKKSRRQNANQSDPGLPEVEGEPGQVGEVDSVGHLRVWVHEPAADEVAKEDLPRHHILHHVHDE